MIELLIKSHGRSISAVRNEFNTLIKWCVMNSGPLNYHSTTLIIGEQWQLLWIPMRECAADVKYNGWKLSLHNEQLMIIAMLKFN
jgi:hypothetical protein